MVVQVAIAVPLSRLFDYLPNTELSSFKSGARVLVPFGRSFKVGVVTGTGPSTLVASRLKPIQKLLDQEPVLSADIVKLIEWASSYYHHPVGEAYAAALPALLRKTGNTVEPVPPYSYRLTTRGRSVAPGYLSRAPLQSGLFDFLAQNQPVTAIECRLYDDRWAAPMKQLIQKGLVEKFWPDFSESLIPDATRPLNPEQQRAVDAIEAHLDEFYSALLYGITGSGKTEVYIEVARSVLKAGKQVLILIPEIGLSPQLLARIRQALGCRVEALHSGLNDSERLLAWRSAANGDAGVVIGTRSAVFTPMPHLGLIVVDEEHDGSLKQQDGFRYHARSLALVRARANSLPIVLGSATPALESLQSVARGQFDLLELTSRAGGASTPQISLVDGRSGAVERGLSSRLLVAMENTLARGEQVIVFINRRGYSPVLMCELCGSIADCQQCDAHMTVHVGSGRLRCHHCGAERALPKICPVCEGSKLVNVGAGTERVDEFLSEKFPDYNVLRIDRDSTSRKGELQRHLEMAASGEAQILVGTQMLAKGHDFPNVTLVGIMDADRGLFGADFRAIEQMGQLIVQVSGRAGRADKPGRVLVQTQNTDHPLLMKLLDEGYGAFARHLLDERKEAAFPPFTYLALLRADAVAVGVARQFLQEVSALADAFNQQHGLEVNVLGPAHAPMERLAGRYRAQLKFEVGQRKPLHALLSWLRPTLEQLPAARKVRWSLDVDPHDML